VTRSPPRPPAEADIVETDFNTHYSSVIFDLNVEATFLAILNHDYEGIEDFRFEGAVST
jgi:hypothetical protein